MGHLCCVPFANNNNNITCVQVPGTVLSVPLSSLGVNGFVPIGTSRDQYRRTMEYTVISIRLDVGGVPRSCMRLIRINTPHVVEQLVLRDIQFNACLPMRLAVTVLYANDTVSRM